MASPLLSDIKWYASAVNPEDNTAVNIGGAIDLTKKHDFYDITTDSYQIGSENAGDTTQSLTTTYRDANGIIQSEVKALNGQTVVTSATVLARVLKCVKSATCAGNVALESGTAVRSNTLPSQVGVPSVDSIFLDAGASAVDNFYKDMVIRFTGGTNNHVIAKIIKYVAATQTAYLSRTLTGVSGDTFSISKGIFFDKTPSEILYVTRFDYDCAANPAGGGEVDYYNKGFFKHTDASGGGGSLTACVVKIGSNPTTYMKFGLDAAVNGTTANGGGNNRKVAPAGISFDVTDQNVPGGGTLTAGDRIGVWGKLALPNGAAALNSNWTPRFSCSIT